MREHGDVIESARGLALDSGHATLLADPPSQALLSVLWSAGSPLTVDELCERSTLSMATVRRSLRQLSDGGVLQSAPDSERDRYQFCPTGLKRLVNVVLPLVLGASPTSRLR